MDELTKLKKEHDALYEQGAEYMRLMNETGEKVIALRDRIKEIEGIEFDPIILLFQGTFDMEE